MKSYILYIMLLILKITSIWISVFMRLSGSNKILETTFVNHKARLRHAPCVKWALYLKNIFTYYYLFCIFICYKNNK